MGPIPEIRVLRAPNVELTGRISAPTGLYAGEVILLGRREPEFYPVEEVPPRTLDPLAESSVSRSQLELRWANGCFHLEAIPSAKLEMRVVPSHCTDSTKLIRKLVVEPKARLWIGASIELYLCRRQDAVVETVPFPIGAQRTHFSQKQANRIIGHALEIQPPAAARLLGQEWCLEAVGETHLLGSNARDIVLCQMVGVRIRGVLTEAEMDIGRAAANMNTPRTTFVRLLDRLSIPRASTLNADDITHTLRAVHGNISRAAERLGVSSTALARRLNRDE